MPWCQPSFEKWKHCLRLVLDVGRHADKFSFIPNAPLLPSQCTAACPQCDWNEVQAGLIEADARSIALMALVINPLSNFCSFMGPLQLCRVARVSESCSHQILCCFLFYGNFLQANLCPCRGFWSVKPVLVGMGCMLGWGLRGSKGLTCSARDLSLEMLCRNIFSCTAACHMGQKHPAGCRFQKWVQKSSYVIAATESFLLKKSPCSNTQVTKTVETLNWFTGPSWH